jgi:hypothetical protein
MESFRFSGHETFPCRYAWLPKAARAVHEDPFTFAGKRETTAMARLGIGKNMVHAMRFWAEITDIITPVCEKGHEVSVFGKRLLLGTARQPAMDPFLEDAQTLWLLHWRMSTQRHAPMFAWDFLLNDWQQEIARGPVLRAFRREANIRRERELSDITLVQHFDMFLHTYLPSRGAKGEVIEDSLDSPFTELRLLQRCGFGEQLDRPGKAEPVYAFRREAKSEISDALFAYCVDEFWRLRFPHEKTLQFGAVISGRGSPGQIFKLPEEDIRSRLERIEVTSDGKIRAEDSAITPRLVREPRKRPVSWEEIYATITA